MICKNLYYLVQSSWLARSALSEYHNRLMLLFFCILRGESLFPDKWLIKIFDNQLIFLGQLKIRSWYFAIEFFFYRFSCKFLKYLQCCIILLRHPSETKVVTFSFDLDWILLSSSSKILEAFWNPQLLPDIQNWQQKMLY